MRRAFGVSGSLAAVLPLLALVLGGRGGCSRGEGGSAGWRCGVFAGRGGCSAGPGSWVGKQRRTERFPPAVKRVGGCSARRFCFYVLRVWIHSTYPLQNCAKGLGDKQSKSGCRDL